jgi:hypothetical protein
VGGCGWGFGGCEHVFDGLWRTVGGNLVTAMIGNDYEQLDQGERAH